ncbi:hypothetical protein ACEP6V_21495 [Pseudomonas aeruginosa]|uniref:hypothetical protein n=1 Tax=Pseudomonadaceae TaxID=135621 RepID=UPI00104E1473|nr:MULTISPECIES: hypothetical protein [Pseudomonas aeruginosa group]BDC78650.1 hypothetical protein MRCP2_p3850 [Pseudomonas alcaligenes]HBO6962681.1 hypothetical protein [Pseudomonas aeruginosa]HBO7218714.1 hypothetical protein [Pseudomonas aeruginosa]
MTKPDIGKIRAAFKRNFGAPLAEKSGGAAPMADPYAGLRGGLVELSARAQMVNWLSSKVTGLLLIGVFLAVALLVSSYITQPPDSLPKLHIPDHIQTLYDRSTESAAEQPSRSFGTSHGVSALSTATDGIFELMNGTLMKVLAGLMIMGGIMSGIIRQSVMSFITGVGGGVMMYNIPIVLSSIVGGASPDVGDHVERAEAKELRTMLASEMLTTLQSLKGIEPGEISYILGQVAIRNDKPESTYVDEAAEFIRSGKATFVIPQSIAYVVEMASDGKVQSPPAKKLQADKAATLRTIQSFRDPLNSICLGLGLCLAIIAGFGHFMSKRVKRIGKMLDQLS